MLTKDKIYKDTKDKNFKSTKDKKSGEFSQSSDFIFFCFYDKIWEDINEENISSRRWQYYS